MILPDILFVWREGQGFSLIWNLSLVVVGPGVLVRQNWGRKKGTNFGVVDHYFPWTGFLAIEKIVDSQLKTLRGFCGFLRVSLGVLLGWTNPLTQYSIRHQLLVSSFLTNVSGKKINQQNSWFNQQRTYESFTKSLERIWVFWRFQNSLKA